jgi:membrane-associated phospholipid phosphatase
MLDPKLWIESLVPWGAGVIQWVHTWHSFWPDAFFTTISNAAGEGPLVLLVALMYWSINRALGIELMYVSGLGSFAMTTLKLAFAIPRPPGAKVLVLWQADNYTFPSGHAQASTTTFGYIATQTSRRWLRTVCLFLIPLVAFSRVYLGAHYPQDVIGGFVLGVICLGLFLLTYSWLRVWVQAQPTATLLICIAFGSAILMGVGSLTERGLAPIVGLVYSGFFAGANIGLILERKYVKFKVDGPWLQRILRWGLGLALVGAAFAVGEAALYLVGTHVSSELRWLQFALIGLAAIWGAPSAFVRTGLCTSDCEAESRQAVRQRCLS